MKKNYYFESGINRFSNSDAELNYQKVPFDEKYNYQLTNKSNPFADCGAWFSYYLPYENKLAFFGPNVISQEVPINLSKYVSNTILQINGKIMKMTNFYFKEKNGQLLIKSQLKNDNFSLKIIKKLQFVSQEDALISLEINVHSKINLKIEILNEIYAYQKIKYKSTNGLSNKKDWLSYIKDIKINKNNIIFNLDPLINKNDKETFVIIHSDNIELVSNTKNDKDNNFKYLYKFCCFDIKANCSLLKKINWYESFFFNKKRLSLDFDTNKINQLSLKTINRWKKYISRFKNLDNNRKSICIKSLYTLIGNWLGPNGRIKSNTIIPSRAYADFIGPYAWDIFKIAYGVCEFDPKLAQEIINSMFDYQIKKNDILRPWDYGMIPDCIFYNYSKDRGGIGNNWNERNTKPPLASWSVLKVFKKSKDIKWLKTIYPKLVLFQQWWIRTRRAKSTEFFLSYGATLDSKNDFKNKKTILEAISWESGMDNAPRFDWDRMKIFGNYVNEHLVSYVADQISVCLNSFYYIELISLNEIKRILEKKYSNELKITAKELKTNVNNFMYSNFDHFYHDIKYDAKKPLIDYGLSIEAFLPLYAKIALKENANDLINSLDENNFLTPFPFPTVAKNNERFNPVNYWRGPIWISLLYFAIIGISNYNPLLAKKITNNIVKILVSKEHINEPLRENYHPLNKKGLSTTNFSWTASMLISLIKEMNVK